MKINIQFIETKSQFSVSFIEIKSQFSVSFNEVQTITEYIGGEIYAGDYVITPKVSEQHARTSGKVMIEDMVIRAIPFFEVSNHSGGNTVFIGNEVL